MQRTMSMHNFVENTRAKLNILNKTNTITKTLTYYQALVKDRKKLARDESRYYADTFFMAKQSNPNHLPALIKDGSFKDFQGF